MLGSDRAEGVTQDGAFRLSEWHDAKGYGWIDAGGKRVFAHIKDFSPGQRRPVAGDEMTFTPGTDEQGRPRAVAVRLMKQAGRIGPRAWGMLALLLVAPIAGGIHPCPESGTGAFQRGFSEGQLVLSPIASRQRL